MKDNGDVDAEFWRQKLLFGAFMRHGEVHRSGATLQEESQQGQGTTTQNEEGFMEDSSNQTGTEGTSPFCFFTPSQVPHIILATSMCNLSLIKQRIWQENMASISSSHPDSQFFLQQIANIKYVLYMHESQWLYPKKPALGFDDQGPYRRNTQQAAQEVKLLAYIQFESLVAADLVCWNSSYHMNEFLGTFGKGYIRNLRVEKNVEEQMMHDIAQKSRVLHVGMELRNRFGEASTIRERHLRDMTQRQKPIVLWNMRWEYDKNPIQFVEALKYLRQEKQLPFHLVICGGHSFQSKDVEQKWFHDQLELFRDDLLHVGYADSATYVDLLTRADVVVSTAIHEFFGISVMEALYSHTFCILPHDLSYPELIPKRFHSQCLYKLKGKKGTLNQLLETALREWRNLPYDELRTESTVDDFDWDRKMAHEYDQVFQQIVGVESGRKRKAEGVTNDHTA